MCSGSIDGKRAYFGLDSCAQASVICKSVIDTAPHLFPTIQPCREPVGARCPNGSINKAIGQITLPFKLNDHPFIFRFFVIPDFSGLALIGLDFFQHYMDGLNQKSTGTTTYLEAKGSTSHHTRMRMNPPQSL